jgi:hypothetical protein
MNKSCDRITKVDKLIIKILIVTKNNKFKQIIEELVLSSEKVIH